MALAIALGAFGAHGLRDRLDGYSMGVYEKAVFYHAIHALGVLIVSLLPSLALLSPENASRVAMVLTGGILFFSGSLYLLAVTGVKWWGAVTPVGGVCFIAGWLLLALKSN